MKTLTKNAINIWGAEGERWLAKLPKLIAELTQQWSLSTITPVPNMRYNYVALAQQTLSPSRQRPVVLKISCDDKLIGDEYQALIHFNGQAAIQVLDYDANAQALLLEQAIPGVSLLDYKPIDSPQVIAVYAQVVRTLAKHSRSDRSFTSVSQWCQAIDRLDDPRVNAQLKQLAKRHYEYLLSTTTNETLCHGDLHCENILKQGDRWLVIDPKGIMGEIAFEAAAFDFIRAHEFHMQDAFASLILARARVLADALQLDLKRLLRWVFVRCMINAAWFIEDQGDPSKMLLLAPHLANLTL